MGLQVHGRSHPNIMVIYLSRKNVPHARVYRRRDDSVWQVNLEPEDADSKSTLASSQTLRSESFLSTRSVGS